MELEKIKNQIQDLLPGAVLWGAGGKGTNLLNLLDITDQKLTYVVDSNPARHGTFIPGTGQEVVSPEIIVTVKPIRVLITNESYQQEIASQLKELGCGQLEIAALDALFRHLQDADCRIPTLNHHD